MLSDRQAFGKLHLRWFLAAAAITVASCGWYGAEAWNRPRWPGGSSLVGLSLGIAAAAIIVFECALVLRKSRWFRTARWLGSAQTWMKAHIWLGLVAVPLVVMHSGFDWGGWLSTLVAGCFALVTASGIFGLWMQNVIPRQMLLELPDETIYSQIDEVARQLAGDARRLVGLSEDSPATAESAARQRNLVISGSPRKVGTIVEREPRPRQETPLAVEIPQSLQEAVARDIVPFLVTGKKERPRLDVPLQSSRYFEELRRQVVVPEMEPVVAALERYCDRRRQLNRQWVLHFWLHGWLAIHLPLAGALLILLAGHVWFALRYS